MPKRSTPCLFNTPPGSCPRAGPALRIACALTLSLVLACGHTHARAESWSLQLDNDEFAGFNRHDRWYSAGWRLDHLSALPLRSGMNRIADLWCAHQVCEPSVQRSWRWSIGQNIYTQDLRNRGAPDPQDRPVGAWLHLSGALLLSSGNQTRMLAALVGITGPGALGEPVQDAMHRILGATRVSGWANGLRPRTGAQLQWLQANRWPLQHLGPHPNSLQLDLITQFHAIAGNLSRQAGVGLSLRLGRHLRGAWLPAEAQQASGLSDTSEHWALQVGASFRGVWAEGLIDGPVFGYAQQLRAARQVGEWHLALSLAPADGWRLRLALIRRAIEFESAATAAGHFHPQRFGTLQISRRFD